MKISFCPNSKPVGYTVSSSKIQKNYAMTESICDSVSFSGRDRKNKVNVDLETAEFVANSLSTSTSGHRAPWGSEEFNEDVVKLLTAGVGQYAMDSAKRDGFESPLVIIGGDTREATRKSLPLIADTLSEQGVDVLYIDEPVPTPLLALMTKELCSDISILLTASHNPWEDGGYNLVTKEGAIAPPSVTKEIANNVVETAKKGYYRTNQSRMGNVTKVYPYDLYKETLNSYDLIDWDKIKNSNVSIYYDGLDGTGEKVFPRLMEDYGIPVNVVHSGKKEGPNPTDENLFELKEAVKNDFANLKIGLANDGDADRFGIVDENGDFISPNDVILLCAHHLSDNKHKKGDIIRSQATSSQLDLFADKNGIEVIQTPVGFKYIAEDIIDMRENKDRDILVAGEESGGLTINGHIPEKDGIIAILAMLDMVAQEEKPVSEILKKTKENTGLEFRAECISKKLPKEEDKAVIMDKMEDIYENALEGEVQFGSFEIDAEKTKTNFEKMESYKQGGDGIKLYFKDGSSLLVRKSGTEPKVKAYIETCAKSPEAACDKLKKLSEMADEIFTV